MHIDRRILGNLDWVLLGAVLALSCVGVMTIYSATRPLPGGEQPDYFLRQIYWIALGLGVMTLALAADYSFLNRSARIIFGIAAALLVLVLVAGRTGMGAQRWISIGPIGFQPSDIFKLALLIALARHLSMSGRPAGVREVLQAFAVYVLVPLGLILKQPDLGTGVVVLGLFGLLMLSRGIRVRALALVIAIALVSIPFVGTVFWDELKDYQKKRILAFVDPDIDPEGISYHIIQSKVAVGSGGAMGKGYMKGTQGPFRFLPEKHTDFVFAIFAEEWGFAGSAVLLALYLLIVLRALHIAASAKDEFGRYLAMGIMYMLGMYVFINIGMTLGLMPVVGIPLPFMSYGGTAMIMNYAAIGVLLSIHARRFELFY